jgi:VWFA-related protein
MFLRNTILLLLCMVLPCMAQTKTDDDVVRITTNLVQVDVVVTKGGKPVRDLKADDFEIFEDGKRQEIVSFAFMSNVTDTAKPPTSAKDPNALPPVPVASSSAGRRMIALVIDDLGLSAQSMHDVRRQVRKFIDEKLDPTDLVAIIRTSRGKRELPQFTSDKVLLNQAWNDQTVWNHCSRVGVKTLRPDDGSGCGNTDASVWETLSSLRRFVEGMRPLSGRKTMVLFSDHVPLRDYESFERPKNNVTEPDPAFVLALNHRTQLNRLAETAIRSSVVIYAVDASGLQVTSLQAGEADNPRVGSPGSRKAIEVHRGRSLQIQTRREGAALLAKETGGFLVHDQNEFQLEKILDEQGGYYLIGYRPSEETFNKRFHKLKARVKKGGFEVRTRSGFFGMSEEEAKRLKN